jgi:bifunctional non-homologous end joining protein LigD
VLRRIPIREKEKTREYVVAEGLPGVMALVQMSVLEIHTWNCVADDLERPNRVIVDLDPGPEVQWPQVLEAAELVRTAFATLGLESFVKTTGGKGLHVVVPLVPERDWDTCFDFARGVAEFIVRQHPKTYTTAMPKAGREKKILAAIGITAARPSRRSRPGLVTRAGLGPARLGQLSQAPVGSFHRRESPAALAAPKHDPGVRIGRSASASPRRRSRP